MDVVGCMHCMVLVKNHPQPSTTVSSVVQIYTLCTDGACNVPGVFGRQASQVAGPVCWPGVSVGH